jgi:hypothetical protein
MYSRAKRIEDAWVFLGNQYMLNEINTSNPFITSGFCFFSSA